jgi:PEGA domain
MTRLVFAIGLVIALTSSARAGGDIGVIVTGDGSMQSQVTAQLESWLSQHGHTLVPSPLPPDAITSLIDCAVSDNPQVCAHDIVEKRSKTPSVVHARVEIKGNVNGTRDVVLTAYWFDKGKDSGPQRKACERCVDQSLRTTVDDVMKKLVGGGDTGHVKLSSNPAGARISIDGQAIGVTPLDWDLPPGQHIIQMDKAGLKPASRAILVASNKIDAVGLVLLPLAGPGSPEQPTASSSSSLKYLPLAGMVVGVGLIATGVVMYAINQDPSPKLGYMIYDTKTEGLIFGISGVVVAGASTAAYFLWFHDHGNSAPVAAISSDSAYVGWTGRF